MKRAVFAFVRTEPSIWLLADTSKKGFKRPTINVHWCDHDSVNGIIKGMYILNLATTVQDGVQKDYVSGKCIEKVIGKKSGNKIRKVDMNRKMERKVNNRKGSKVETKEKRKVEREIKWESKINKDEREKRRMKKKEKWNKLMNTQQIKERKKEKKNKEIKA